MNPPIPTPVVEIEGLRAGYGGEDVLKGVTLSLHGGEVFALLGPNGAGKSTLMRVLADALRPRAGRVAFASHRAAVGLVPQQIALYSWLSPSENCWAFGRLSGLSRRSCAARVGPVMALTGCEPVAATPVARLSGGYQRRANVAAALMNEPQLLILDEPTSGLDAEGRAHIAATTAALRRIGAAILLVTHDFDFAESVADRVGVLAGGALVVTGALPELLAAKSVGGDRVELQLKDAPDAAARERLAALGAAPTPDPRLFRYRGEDMQALGEQVAAAGLRLAEWRARPAGLRDVFDDAVAEARAA